MISLIEAKNYRCLKYIRQPLDRFHVLVGPNASGKTTFLDVIGFLGDLITEGLEKAVIKRTSDFRDMVWRRKSEPFELVLEATIPKDRKEQLKKPFDTIRYEVRIGIDNKTNELSILEERAWLKPAIETKHETHIRHLFPMEPDVPETILARKNKMWQRILSKAYGGNDNFYVEVREAGAGKGWFPSIRLGPRKSALANLPEDEKKFPVTTWFKQMLLEGVQQFSLNSLLIRKASTPHQRKGLNPDGSNLPWVIWELEQPKNKEKFKGWINHIRSALPDIKSIRTVERSDDKHRYLMIQYQGGLEVPSWMASDGTLRLLALTIPAYLPDFTGICLIEEPENGIHPLAVETVFQSLSSIYESQVLLATHSPIVLSIAEARNVLCFKKTEEGATDIVRGNQHPELKDWKGETDLGTLFASGVLG